MIVCVKHNIAIQSDLIAFRAILAIYKEYHRKKQTDKRETRERTKTQDELAYIKSNSG